MTSYGGPAGYSGPLTKRGLPKRKPLNEHAGFRIEGWEKRECWPEVLGGKTQ